MCSALCLSLSSQVSLLFLIVYINKQIKMVRCVAYGCSNTSSPGCGWSFHSFPADSDELRHVRQQWIVFCRRVEKRNGRQINWTPTKSAKLCSEHFSRDSFERDPSHMASYGYLKAKARLKRYAVPTIRPCFQSVSDPPSMGSASAPMPSPSRVAQQNRESLAAKRAKQEVNNSVIYVCILII